MWDVGGILELRSVRISMWTLWKLPRSANRLSGSSHLPHPTSAFESIRPPDRRTGTPCICIYDPDGCIMRERQVSLDDHLIARLHRNQPRSGIGQHFRVDTVRASGIEDRKSTRLNSS